VFGTLYGITAHGLNARMGFTEERAQEIINKLMNRFPDIQTYIEDTKREISLKGFVATPYGRFRRFPMAKVGRWMEGRNHRQGVNFLIQSYCSDIVMSCLKNIAATRRDVALRLLLTVHDSICFEMPLRLIKELPAYLNRSVEGHIKSVFPDMPVTMPYDVTVGYSYGETKDIKKFVQNML
jgi:DNA polymerase I-like protein with 3'-5' exonuclease and polymerase domains